MKGILFLSLFCLLSWFFLKVPLAQNQKELLPTAQILGPLTTQEKILFGYPLSINQLSAKDWELFPRIGPKIAQRIVAHRLQNGDFKTVEDLVEVPGVGPKTVENLKLFLLGAASKF